MNNILSYVRLFRAIPKKAISSFNKVNKEMLKYGIFSYDIKEEYSDIIDKIVEYFDKDFTNTFYKTFERIENTPVEKRYFEQALHYFTTYGASMFGLEGQVEVFQPEDKMPKRIRQLKVLRVVEDEQVKEYLKKFEENSLALSQKTIDDILSIAEDYNYQFDLDKIKNRELRIKVIASRNIIPESSKEMMQVINYLITGSPSIIKDKETQFKYLSANERGINYFLEMPNEKLAEVFFRYKDLFLALKKIGNPKHSIEIKKKVNRIRRIANKLWKPIKPAEFLITKIRKGFSNFEDYKKLDIYQQIKILNKVRFLILYAESEDAWKQNVYLIRNGKAYFKEELVSPTEIMRLKSFETLALDYLKDKFKDIIITNVPENIRYTIPESEKQFIGEMPIGTQIMLDDASVIGIQWKNQNNRQTDLDLSLIEKEGSRYGWNSEWLNRDRTIIYTGDQTTANPSACEAMYVRDSYKDKAIFVNLYNVAKAPYTLFISTESKEDLKTESGKKYIVDESKIVYQTELDSLGREELVAILDESNKFLWLTRFAAGYNAVSTKNGKNYVIETAKLKAESTLKLDDIFTVDNLYMFDEEKDEDKTIVDFAEFSKALMINLLTEND